MDGLDGLRVFGGIEHLTVLINIGQQQTSFAANCNGDIAEFRLVIKEANKTKRYINQARGANLYKLYLYRAIKDGSLYDTGYILEEN